MSKRKPQEVSPDQHELAWRRKEVDRLARENTSLRNGVEHVLHAAGETEPSGEDWASRIFNAFKRLQRDLCDMEGARDSAGAECASMRVYHERSLAEAERLREENECLKGELSQTYGIIAAYVDSQGGQVEIPLAALARSDPGWVLTTEDDWRGMVRIIRVRKDGE